MYKSIFWYHSCLIHLEEQNFIEFVKTVEHSIFQAGFVFDLAFLAENRETKLKYFSGKIRATKHITSGWKFQTISVQFY